MEEYHIYNTITQESRSNLSGAELQDFLTALNSSDKVNILVWKAGLAGWSPLEACPELSQIQAPIKIQEALHEETLFLGAAAYYGGRRHEIPSLNHGPSLQHEEAAESIEVKKMKSVEYPQRRQSPRIQKDSKIVLIQGKKAFRTKAIDISTGGVFLKSPPPDEFMQEPSNVFIIDEDLPAPISATTGGGGSGDRRCLLKFASVEEDSIESLDCFTKSGSRRIAA